jgi:spore coat protein U-like protein
MRTALVIALVAAACCRGAASPIPTAAHATDAHPVLAVTATVVNACDVGGSPSLRFDRGLLDFGTHRLGDGVIGGQGATPVKATMPVLCNNGRSAPQVSFDFGLHPSGTQRHLQGPGGSLIPYDLLRGSSPDAGVWDDNAYPVALVGGEPGDIPVYGLVRSVPVDAEDGLYTDTVVVRVDF